MATSCMLCGKKKRIGNRVSHANNKSKRFFLPNLQTVWAVIGSAARRIRVCTACIRSGLVVKPG